MIADATIGWALLAIYAALCAGAAAQDVRQHTISNKWFLGLLGLGLIGLGLLTPPNWYVFLITFAVAFVIGFALFSLGWWGGGDAKLFAGAALMFTPSALVFFAVGAAISGGLFVLVRVTVWGMKGMRKRKLPYGVPLSGSAIACALLLPEQTMFFTGKL